MRTLRLAAVALFVTAPLMAQGNSFYNGATLTSGAQFKSYSFGSGATFEKVSQFAVPLGAVIPVSERLSVDVGTFYAVTSTTTASTGEQSVSGLSDLQVRGSFTMGRDAAVLSLLVNLPTGAKFDIADAATAGAAASNFLLFPVNSYSNGLSVTTGLGVAKRVGEWGIGVAGSFRWSAQYAPFSTDSVRYEPGMEGRVRIGADRTMGQGRIRFGLTYSTFGDDVFGAGSGADTKYSPGGRFVAEGSYSWPGLGGTMSAYVWDYHRSSGADTADANNGENILTVGVMARRPLGSMTTLEPALEGRFWSYNAGVGGGKVVALAVGLRHRFNERVSLVPTARVELGSLDLGAGESASMTGLGVSVFLRYGF